MHSHRGRQRGYLSSIDMRSLTSELIVFSAFSRLARSNEKIRSCMWATAARGRRRQGRSGSVITGFGGLCGRGRHLFLVALRAGDETERAGLLLDLPAGSKAAQGSRDPHAKHSRGISVHSLVLSQVCQMCSTRQFSDSSSILIIREPRHTRRARAGRAGPGGETSHGCP